MAKIEWNMNEIHEKRNEKNIKKTLNFLEKYCHMYVQKQKR
jgi:hypothetical protein